MLVVTEDGDLHARAVASLLRSRFDTRVACWHIGAMPAAACAFEVGHGAARTRTLLEGGIPLDDVGCIWWRRPSAAEPGPSLDAAAARFRADEIDAFVRGMLWSQRVAWVNDPQVQRRSREKLVQLAAACAAGLAVPETIVTNDPHEARAFLARLAPSAAVVKRVSATPGLFVETRLVTEAELARLDALRSCPAILQAYIDGVMDIRLTWMGGDVRCVAIDSQSGTGRVDSRLDLSVAYVPHVLPDDVLAGLRRLMDALGLAFGVIDLRLDRDGRYWFLEVNPQGQFAYMELKSQVPFVEPFAAFLAETAMAAAAGRLRSPSSTGNVGTR